MNSLVVKNLSKSYDKFKLENISFAIPKGYIMGFIGENGAGKTTTINALLNIIKKDSGEVTIFDKNMDIHEIELKRNIGFVSGDSFYLKSRVKDITDVYKRFYDNWDNLAYHDFLKQFEIDPSKRLEELSKGMKMKYSIALALSHKAELLILDEPTSGLDPVARDNLLEIFQSLVEDGTVSILFSTHITSDLEKCADYITFIQSGKMIDTCSKDDLIDKYRIVTGTKDELKEIEKLLVSYKVNAFGFNGLIKTEKMIKNTSIKFGQPTLDDIMIYFANKEVQK